MKKAKWILLAVAAAVLVAALVLILSFCGKPSDTPADDQGSSMTPTAGESTEYTVAVKTAEGTPIEGVGIYVYQDETKEELIWFDKTGKDGAITFTDLARDTYVAVLSDVPTGYDVEDMYPLTGTTTEIILHVGVLTEEDMANIKYMLGDKIMDFTVTDTDGKSHTLSELLQTRKAVMLNFWYINCEPCAMEFPYMAEAYDANKKDIEILAMNPVDTDEAAIAQYKAEHGLPFPVIMADPLWASMMQITGYPTSVMIDRYGNISLIHKGSIESANTFDQIFKYFAADEYVAKTIKSLDEILVELPVGTKENPFETGSFKKLEITVPSEETYYIRLYKQIEKYYLSIDGKDCEADFTLLYNDKEYEDENGELTVYIRPEGTFVPVWLEITNNSDEEQTYILSRSTARGTYSNPYKMVLGEFEAKISAGNDQGVYYTYTAEKEGELKISCLRSSVGERFALTLYNLRSYAMRNWDSEIGQKDEDGNPYLTIKVKKGHKVQFILNTEPNDSNQYPAGNFTLLAEFTEGDGDDITINDLPKTVYTLTVTDQNGNPVKDVSMAFAGDFYYVVEEEKPGEDAGTETAPEGGETTEPGTGDSGETTEPGTGDSGETTEPGTGDEAKLQFHIRISETLKTDKDGKISTEQVTGPYSGTIRVPEGYRLDITQYDFTPEAPDVAVQMYKINYLDYTVKLQYADGTPVPGVAVMIGSDFKSTDNAGAVAFNLIEGQHTVSLAGLPEGYALAGNLTTAVFPEGESAMVLTLYALGQKENPMEVKAYPYTTPVIGVGEKLYVNVYYPTAPVLTAADPDVVISYNGTDYTADPATGILELPMAESDGITPVSLIISHNGAEAKAVEVDMVFPLGSQWNPQPIENLDDIQLVLAEGDEDGYYYRYTSTTAGTLSLHLNSVTPEGTLYEGTVTSVTTGTLPLATDTQVYIKANEPAVIYVRALPVTIPPATEEDVPVIVNPALTLALTGDFEVDREAIDDSDAIYTVTVQDYDGTRIAGAMVQILAEDKPVATGFTNAEGVFESVLARNAYKVSVAVSGETKYYYEETAALFHLGITQLTVEMTSRIPGEPVTDKDAYIIGEAPMIEVGATYVTMQKDSNRYFLFQPGESGTYRVTVSDPDAIPSYWGNEFFPTEIVDDYNADENCVDISVAPDQLGVMHVVAVKGAEDAIVTITRIGRHDWNIEEEPYSNDWQSDYVPKKFTFTGNVNNIVYVDLKDADKHYELVFNENDQFYHLGSVDGPVLYLNFGNEAPIKSINEIMHGDGVYGGRGLSRVFLVEGATKVTEETFVKKEDYTDCMDAYIACADTKYDMMYPLTKDIMYAVQNGCRELWTDPNNILYENFATAVEGRQWMFAVCYEDDGSVDLSVPAQTEEETAAETGLPETEQLPQEPAEGGDAPEQEEAAPPKEEDLLSSIIGAILGKEPEKDPEAE